MSGDELLHYLGGYAMALPWRLCRRAARVARVDEIDRYGWAREVEQHDEVLTPHQVEEARAWGRGARAALGVDPPWPVPPYPTHG